MFPVERHRCPSQVLLPLLWPLVLLPLLRLSQLLMMMTKMVLLSPPLGKKIVHRPQWWRWRHRWQGHLDGWESWPFLTILICWVAPPTGLHHPPPRGTG